MKLKEKAEARRLRGQKGWPIKRIARELGVSPSSVSLWVRDIALTEEQHRVLRGLNPSYNARLRGQNRRRETARDERLGHQALGRSQAGHGNLLHAQGCMLFWAEGSRKRNAVIFVNSDVAMLQLFLKFLRECYTVPDEQITLSCNCFLNNGLVLDEIEAFWLDKLDLPRTCLRKPIINTPSSAGRAEKRTLLYGTARLAVHSTEIVQTLYGAIQEYGGFDRPEWLDCAPGGVVGRRS